MKYSIEALNSAVSKMDSMILIGNVEHDGMYFLRIEFSCLNGGEYENITICIDFETPDAMHLPFYMQGHFQLYFLSDSERIELTRGRMSDYNLSCGLIVNSEKKDGFYITCDGMSWKAQGLSEYLVGEVNKSSGEIEFEYNGMYSP